MIVIPDRQTAAIISKIKGQSIYAFKKFTFYMSQGRLVFHIIADVTFPVENLSVTYVVGIVLS